jgi:hypothetical protein
MTDNHAVNDAYVIVCRGLPGAGKSTYVATLSPGAVVCSADSYFVGPDGAYRFDPAKLGQAHEACWTQATRLHAVC